MIVRKCQKRLLRRAIGPMTCFVHRNLTVYNVAETIYPNNKIIENNLTILGYIACMLLVHALICFCFLPAVRNVTFQCMCSQIYLLICQRAMTRIYTLSRVLGLIFIVFLYFAVCLQLHRLTFIGSTDLARMLLYENTPVLVF